MRIGEYLGEIINGSGGHAEVAKFLDPLIAWAQPQTLIQQALKFSPIVATSGAGCVAFVIQQPLHLEMFAELGPHRLRRRRKVEDSVAGMKQPVGRTDRMMVSRNLRHFSQAQ